MPTLEYQSAIKPPRKPVFTPPRILIAISFLLYLLSLPLPACYVDSGSFYGGQLFLAGCFCGFLAYPAALVNPLLFSAWPLIFFSERRRIVPLAFALAAFGLSLSFLFNTHLMLDEAGNEAAITKRGPAYWLWVASTAVALIASIAKLRIAPPSLPPPQPPATEERSASS